MSPWAGLLWGRRAKVLSGSSEKAVDGGSFFLTFETISLPDPAASTNVLCALLAASAAWPADPRDRLDAWAQVFCEKLGLRGVRIHCTTDAGSSGAAAGEPADSRETSVCGVAGEVDGGQTFELYRDGTVVGTLEVAGGESASWSDADTAAVTACLAAELARRAEVAQTLRLSARRFDLLAAGSNDGIFEWDVTTDTVKYSPRWCAMFGLDPAAVAPTPDAWYGLVSSSDLGQLQADVAMHLAGQTDELRNEHRITDADGRQRWVLCRARASFDDAGEARTLVGSLSDVTDFKHAEASLRHAAEHDKLTGLPNRALLSDQLKHALRRNRISGGRHRYALLFLDFDRFKVINDSMGHDVGDELLVGIADRLRSEVRGADTPARLGGDEFVVLLESVTDIEGVKAVANRLLKVFSEPHQLRGFEVTSTASIGIVTCDHGYARADEVLRDADTAMYHAKAMGKACYVVFDERMHAEAIERLKAEKGLRHAIANDELLLEYQPVMDLQTGRASSFEALLRWRHDGQTIAPENFIPLAEETGLIVPIGHWVLATACKQLRAFDLLGFAGLRMNVNVSRKQLIHPKVAESLRQVAVDHGVDPSRIVLEITESVVVDGRTDLTATLVQLRDAGFALAMDDFGTGQSSLSCLHKFPINDLKIDRSFIRDMGERASFVAVIQAVVSLAQTLGLNVVAEGVETAAQLEQLRGLGCDKVQGYFLARPMDAEHAITFLATAAETAQSA